MSLALKITVAILGIIVIVLLGVLAFVPAAKSPNVADMGSGTNTPTSSSNFAVSSDGTLEVSLPHAGDIVSSPLAIEGQETGGEWFFEASFPITVLDGDGSVIGLGEAQALSDWMTTGTVPFSASITFKKPRFATGTILFENDNPSGFKANQKSFRLPIIFK